MENVFRIELNFFGAFIAIMVIWIFCHKIHVKSKEDNVFMAITYCTLLELVLDSLFWMIDGRLLFLGKELNVAINTIYYFLQFFVCFLWANYCLIHMDSKEHKIINLTLVVGCIVVGMLLILNVFTGIVFSVNGDNVYQRTWGVLGTGYAIICAWLIIFSLGFTILKMCRGTKKMKSDGKYLIFVSIVPLVSMLIQMKVYGLNFIWCGMSLALLLVLEEVEIKQYHRMEEELIKNRVQIMLSQIQPHFLYNALTSIQSLCVVEPEKAQHAIKEFSLYLRANMDSLTSTELISFRKELDHVKNYLSLEQLRFEELLHIEYDIQVEDFFLPALTLQPIVENAVKYGVGRKEEGGTVQIITKEENNQILIIVKDDGVGFNVTKIEELEKRNDGRTHIGLNNVKNRLENMCQGTIEIQSEEGVGTTMIIGIPRE